MRIGGTHGRRSGTDELLGGDSRSHGGLLGLVTQRMFRAAFLAGALGVIALGSLWSFSDREGTLQGINRQLIQLDAAPVDQYLADQETYREWLLDHGVAIESKIFDGIAARIGNGVLAAAHRADHFDEWSFGTRVLISLLSGVQRISFMAVAGLRLWIAGVLVCFAWGYRRRRSHNGTDLLGQTGNGRLFYSGIHLTVEETDEAGFPVQQIPGLACPAYANTQETADSRLGWVLKEFQALSKTSERLAAIVVKHQAWKPYIASPDEDEMLDRIFQGNSLSENAASILHAVLTLHGLYAAGALREGMVNVEPQRKSEGLSSDEYATALKRSLHQVLTPQMRTALGKLPASHIAALVLAIEAGKVLSHRLENTRWVSRSLWPQLNARAVLHSVPSFGQEFTPTERSVLRQALVYALRRSPFGVVNTPVDFHESAEALRQWAELLCALPHELEALSDEVELFGLTRAAHRGWCREFLDSGAILRPEFSETAFSTSSGQLFFPIAKAAEIYRVALGEGQRRRLEQLIQIVSTRQRLEALTTSPGEPLEQSPVLSRRTVMAPLSQDERAALTTDHGLSAEDLRDWSSLRVVLAEFGWFARRVGDLSLPEANIVHASFDRSGSAANSDQKERFSVSGLTVWRGTRMQERWGRSWGARFLAVDSAGVWMTREEFERASRVARTSAAPERVATTSGSTAIRGGTLS